MLRKKPPNLATPASSCRAAAAVDKAAREMYDHSNGFYDEVGEDGKNLTFLCKLPVDKIIVVCGCIWAMN